VELFIIRHGESANNALQDASQRVKDPELTAKGERQAEHVAEFLQTGGHLRPSERGTAAPLDQLYCSAMIRALQTAQPIGKATGLRAEVWVDIHEIGGIYLDHGGEKGLVGYSGQTQSEIQRRFDGYQLPDEIGENGWWNRDMESLAESQGRAIAVASALQRRAGEQTRIGLVSHGAFTSCLLQALAGGLPNEQLYYDHYNTAITRISFSAKGQMTVVYQNRAEHLPDELVSGALS
jgi:probable phosphoglycerate mutase